MILDAGILRLYHAATSSSVSAGDRPEDALEVYYAAWYGERVVGYNRYYTAQGAGTRVDRVVRCVKPHVPVLCVPESRGGDMCRLADGSLYRIVQTQYLRDEESGEDVCDLSLERIGERFEKGGGA